MGKKIVKKKYYKVIKIAAAAFAVAVFQRKDN